jgi:hypothetical protein
MYHTKNQEVKPLIKCDFGTNSIPKDFFTVPPDEKLHKFTAHRKKSVLGFSRVTVTDNRITCYPEESPAPALIFYDRKQHRPMTGRDSDIPLFVLDD